MGRGCQDFACLKSPAARFIVDVRRRVETSGPEMNILALLLIGYLAGFVLGGYGLAALIRGRMTITRHRELRGFEARLAGFGCLLAACVYLFCLAGMADAYLP
jgi:hypothetical protein